ncbi:ADP-ribose 1''-phosphate phosphatase NDAI_0A07250 [Naumovozyma dairenensis CBS 421]|uniref:ADP-ribose 1''-phosphate phosphatase n=1 Tax=Naumovozyma dairenensis (strain ATCC 10597 / BCRC 20456 / CBS 421 / NBRC 0211 / NRRL Y-12639) TaxID=1071378 RepID=G0W4Z1_NAUDC|nr:hypothetical protein NDAI_0A07250 [Naumovozyma dairenensis CBS 421]CCD22879.1 hypothetical protein NDAI_0A07250 [Naumovozyma dairenensis CBS 421]
MQNIKYAAGDLLKPRTYKRIIIHSCNCNGSWGGGFAYALARKYPQAEDTYMKHCDKYGANLLGTCLLLPSFEGDNVLIACLFTSAFGGSRHDDSRSILEYTEMALNDLMDTIETRRIDEMHPFSFEGENLKNFELEMPKINSGIFGVPWAKTEEILKKYKHQASFTVYAL